jgi:hypothetical protein
VPLGTPDALRSQKRGLTQSQGAQVGQEDKPMSNCCIKERKEERKTRGPRGAWKGPYLDPKGALGGPQQVPLGAPSRSLGGPIRALRGINWGS